MRQLRIRYWSIGLLTQRFHDLVVRAVIWAGAADFIPADLHARQRLHTDNRNAW